MAWALWWRCGPLPSSLGASHRGMRGQAWAQPARARGPGRDLQDQTAHWCMVGGVGPHAGSSPVPTLG